MDWRVVCLLLSCLSGIFACTLITPGILRADTDETIVLDGHNSGFDAEITVQEFPVKRQILAEGRIAVNSNNDFLGTMKIHIKSQNLLNEQKKRYYVSVKVTSPQCAVEKVVAVFFQSGYIFIQTDKTIYTPGSKVLYRIYPLNYKMQSAKQSVVIEIKNPDGIVTVKEQFFPDKSGIISKSYDLSELAWLGSWTMTACYENSHDEFSAHFDVKEYVLPSFEVTIKPEKSFMYIDDKTFSVTIESRYVFKKPVNGIAFALFGLKKGDEKRSLTDSLRKIQIEEGIGHVELQRRDLVKSFKNPEDLLQYKLYVSVTVITDEGSDFVEAELDNIYIVNSPYKIIFTRTSKYFKPGMPYDLLVMVTNPDGSPAKNIAIVANPGDYRGTTHRDGIARLKLNTALNVKSLKITVRTAVPRLPDNLQASKETSAEAYRSLNGQDNYLHIGVVNNILEPKTQIHINFNILNSNINIQNQITRFTYLILSKGQIIMAGKYNRQVGQVLVSMPLVITEDFMPSFRIVAYYTVANEIVPDSLWLDVVDDCTGTLSLKADKNIGKPQERIKLTLKADHNANVGLVAVDKGVFTINSKHKLTQSKIWDTVEKSDIGCSPGSGADNMGVFYDAGLAVQTNFGMTTAERSDQSCKDKTRRRRSSVALMDLKTQKASSYTNLEKQCCNDGMIKNRMGHSCERRALFIQEGEKCKEAFLDCCRYIDLKLKMERLIKESDQDLDRSENDLEYYPDADILVRSEFPESWLWSIVKMDEKPDAEKCSLITPSVLRVDSEETIIVDGQGTGFNAEITIEDFPRREFSLAKSKVSVNSGNHYFGKITLTISSVHLEKDPNKKQYVYVIVRSEQCSLEKVVLVSFQSGYIFIQTDKPIYTPGSTVLFRIFTMDPNLRPVQKSVVFEFLTPAPDNIIVRKEQLISKTGIMSLTHKLTDLVSLGLWTISAKYEETLIQSFTTQFEVKEYVLPSFEIKLTASQSFFYFTDKTLAVKIEANYIYGKPVKGKAFVLFGVKKDDKKKVLPDTLRSIGISDGEGSTTLKREDLVKYFEREEDMLDYSLYVSVTVITDSGSDLVESELENIFIVKSPYKINFAKTSTFFKPRMPFNLMVFVTNPDGSPAHRVPVEVKPGNSKGPTRQDGTVQFVLNTESNQKKLQITVSTIDTKLTEEQQASATMEAFEYETLGGNYLHLSVSGDMKPDEVAVVTFNIWNSDSDVQNQIKQFNYVIMNKGRIMKVGTQARKSHQNPVTMLLTITKEFIPSFRILAYYTVTTGAGREIVADSVWIDVVDTCMGTLVVTGERDKDNAIQRPGGNVSLKLQADHNAAVGLVAVDKAVYVINSKLKITQKKIWDSVEKYDIGCTPGSGANAPRVFYDAGFALQTSFQMRSPDRTEISCQPKLKRRRRSSALLIQEQDKKASQYTGQEKKCCQDGMHKNSMGHSCDRRSRNIVDGQKCVDAFLDCCRHITKQKERERELKEKDEDSRNIYDDDFLHFADVTIRTVFKESFLWDVKIMNEKPDAQGISTKIFPAILKDSITTWEVLAVSLSESKGICVSQPHNIRVMMNFFIDLKLPYSVVRNEQVEIRAILYNYGDIKMKVRVEWAHNENFCSLSTAKKNYRQELNIKPLSSVTAPFVIMPLTLGEHNIEVKAVSQFVSDGVRKTLKVVPEGRRVTEILKSVVLDPNLRGGVQEEQITMVAFKNVVPDTKVSTIVTIQGTPISELLEKSTDGVNLNHLIQAPGGCGEQIMMKTTAPLIATHYLDSTRQWERIGLERRELAIQYIKDGVVQQLAYKKPDASYGTWIQTPSSTWLTAYVVKVFSMSSSLVDIDKKLICDSVKWLLLNKQNPDGEFREDSTVYHQEMVGGITNEAVERDSTLTAFVLIALLESKATCKDLVDNLPGSIENAVEYIKKHYYSLEKPYSIALTSYALAKAGKLMHIQNLMSASTDNIYWEESDSRLLSLEATSYALLTLLKLKMFEKAGPLVKWITEQRYYGENYGSTQSTMMQFEALAQYQIDAPGVKDLEMDVSFKLSGRSGRKTYRLDLNNALVPRSEETNEPRNFTVTAKGKGQGTLKAFAVYYAIETEKEKECNNFDLSVTIKDEPDAKRPEGAKSTVSIEICTRYLRKQDASMSIIDISLMTGFAPDTTELKQLKHGVDKYISNFEINKGAFDKGTLILYLDKVSHTEEYCVKFNLHQYFQVGLIQPGSVTVYDYYSPERRCTKFYHVDEKSKLLGKICKGEMCNCAEGDCFMQQQLENVNALVRLNKSCEPGVDYAYKLTLNKIEKKENYYNYVMTIITVIKVGTDIVIVNDKRDFISHAKCAEALNLVVGRDYIIWGLSKDLWLISSSGYSYMITKSTWIEMWPSERECQEDKYFQLCEDFENFTAELEIRGCLQ